MTPSRPAVAPAVEEKPVVVFPDCHECPKPGHFHGKDCWALAEIARAKAKAARAARKRNRRA